ncbi:MAG: hypothetical protein ACPGNP_13355 [Acidimicrobiales bacterium]
MFTAILQHADGTEEARTMRQGADEYRLRRLDPHWLAVSRLLADRYPSLHPDEFPVEVWRCIVMHPDGTSGLFVLDRIDREPQLPEWFDGG